MPNKIINKLKQTALLKGLKRYESITACKRCHKYERYILNNNCVGCAKKCSQAQKVKMREGKERSLYSGDVFVNPPDFVLFCHMRESELSIKEWEKQTIRLFPFKKDNIRKMVLGHYDKKLNKKYDVHIKFMDSLPKTLEDFCLPYRNMLKAAPDNKFAQISNALIDLSIESKHSDEAFEQFIELTVAVEELERKSND